MMYVNSSMQQIKREKKREVRVNPNPKIRKSKASGSKGQLAFAYEKQRKDHGGDVGKGNGKYQNDRPTNWEG